MSTSSMSSSNSMSPSTFHLPANTFSYSMPHSMSISQRASPSSSDVVRDTYFTSPKESSKSSSSSKSISAAPLSSSLSSSSTWATMEVSSQILSSLPTPKTFSQASTFSSSSSYSSKEAFPQYAAASYSASSSSPMQSDSILLNVCSKLHEFYSFYEQQRYTVDLERCIISPAIFTINLTLKALADFNNKISVALVGQLNYEKARQVAEVAYIFDPTSLEVKETLAFVIGELAHLHENSPTRSLFEYSLASDFYQECASIITERHLPSENFKALLDNFAKNHKNFTSKIISS